MIILYIYEMMILGRLDLLLASLVIKNSRWFSAIASCAYLLDPRDDGKPCFVIRAARNKKVP